MHISKGNEICHLAENSDIFFVHKIKVGRQDREKKPCSLCAAINSSIELNIKNTNGMILLADKIIIMIIWIWCWWLLSVYILLLSARGFDQTDTTKRHQSTFLHHTKSPFCCETMRQKIHNIKTFMYTLYSVYNTYKALMNGNGFFYRMNFWDRTDFSPRKKIHRVKINFLFLVFVTKLLVILQ